MRSKTIIISNVDQNSSSGRGILTLYQENSNTLKCKLRLYQMEKLNRFCKLGIYHNDQVYSANLLDKGESYESSLLGNFDMNSDFYTAIIDTSSDNKVLLAGGTYAGYYFDDTSVFSDRDKYYKDEKYIGEKNENVSDCEIDKCANCEYKKCFYDNSFQEYKNIEVNNDVATEISEEKINTFNNRNNMDNLEEKKEENTAPNILDAIIPQFKYIFENYPEDEDLNKLIENSKFVKIGEDGEQYSIGAIYENDQIKYICYAIKCNYNSPAPEELGKNYQWLPLDQEDPLSEGYYIVYQDAVDLKIVEIER